MLAPPGWFSLHFPLSLHCNLAWGCCAITQFKLFKLKMLLHGLNADQLDFISFLNFGFRLCITEDLVIAEMLDILLDLLLQEQSKITAKWSLTAGL